ncbi:hypothetical protein D3C78_1065770 [compost metagenome]
MSADILGHGMHNDIGPKLNRLAEDWRSHRVVDHQRYAAGVSSFSQGFEVNDVTRRVADAFAVHQLGVVVDQFGDSLGRVISGKTHIHAKAWQQVGE